MDVKAGLPINASTALHVQPDQSPDASTRSNAQRPPTLHSFDRWHEMPDDITFQVMTWMMHNERSGSAPASFATTSKAFYQLGHAFRRHHLYKSMQSTLLHTGLANNSRRYIDRVGKRHEPCGSKNPGELLSLLQSLSRYDGASGTEDWLCLEKTPEPTFFDTRVHEAIRAFKGRCLPVWIGANEACDVKAFYIAKTLPKNVHMNIFFSLEKFDEEKFAELIKNTCTRGHITSLELIDSYYLTRHPAVRQRLVDVFCGDGLVSNATFEYMTNNLLVDLIAKFQEIRHLRLLSIRQPQDITYAEVQALAAAVEQRHASGQTRITVALDVPKSLKLRPDSLFSSPERLSKLEGAGLFFIALNWTTSADRLNAIRLSVDEGPICQDIN